MRIEFQEVKNTFIVRMYGELDLHTVEDVRRLINEALGLTTANILLLNLSEVSFMDSSGLGLILGQYRRLLEKNIKLRLVTPPSQVRRVLELSGIDQIIPIYNHEETAYKGEGDVK